MPWLVLILVVLWIRSRGSLTPDADPYAGDEFDDFFDLESVTDYAGDFVSSISETFTSLIARFEGFSPTAYRDANGWSIGYGHFILPGEEWLLTATITEQQAQQFLMQDSQKAAAAVDTYVTVPLTANQRSALISFTYNVGVSAFRGSTLLRKLNAGDYAGAAAEFPRWNKSSGSVLSALVDRRGDEQTLFLS